MDYVRSFGLGWALLVGAATGCIDPVSDLASGSPGSVDGGGTDRDGGAEQSNDAGEACEPDLRTAMVSSAPGWIVAFSASTTGLFVSREAIPAPWVEKIDWATNRSTLFLREYEPNTSLRLLSAHQDELLVARGGGGTSGSRVWRWSEREGYARVGTAETRFVEANVRRWIASGLAIFIDDRSAQWALVGRRNDGQVVSKSQVLAASVDGDVLAVVQDRGPQWSVSISTGGLDVEVQRFDRPSVTGPARAPIIADAHLYWQTGSAVWRASLETLEPERLAQDCDLLAAKDGAVVVGCARSGNGVQTYGRIEWALREPSTRSVPQVEGVVTDAVLLQNGRLVWVEYEDAGVLCSGSDGPAGRVRSWVLGARDIPVDVAEVRAPCICCGAYWPPPILDGAGIGAVWNYDAATPPERAFPLGFAAWVGCEP